MSTSAFHSLFIVALCILVLVLLTMPITSSRTEEAFTNESHSPFRTYDIATLDRDTFLKLINRNEPCVFTNVFNTDEYRSFDHISRVMPQREIRVRYGSYKTPEGRVNRKFRNISLHDYYSNPTAYYVGNNTISQSELLRLGIRPTASFMHRFPKGKLWIGTKGTRTPLHKDRPYNLSLQLHGTKEWTVFSNTDIPLLCYEQENRKLEWSNYSIGNAASCPSAQKAKPFMLRIKKGEMLYLPKQWSHDVQNLSNNVMVNFWFDDVSRIVD